MKTIKFFLGAVIVLLASSPSAREEGERLVLETIQNTQWN